MRFQGENCTLSFGMSFTKEQMLLTGSIWFRRDAPAQVRPEPIVPNRIPLRLALTETEFDELRHWLTTDAPAPLQLPDPLRHLRRVHSPQADVTVFEIELCHEQLPAWWNWDVVFPLTVRLIIRPREYAYLTNTLNREQWSANLIW